MMIDDSKLRGMGAEPGYEVGADIEPARVSGFFALAFGILSVISFMGSPLLLIPVVAIGLGWLALRKTPGQTAIDSLDPGLETGLVNRESQPPLGTGAAKVGMTLAVCFGVFGYALPALKQATLGAQAERFSREYIELVALGEDMLARELQKSFAIRLPASMSLVEYYAANPQALEQLATFRSVPLNAAFRDFGPQANWTLDQPVRIEYHLGRQQAEVVWRDPNGEHRVQFFMVFQFDSQGVGQWHVETAQVYRERIIAEQIL